MCPGQETTPVQTKSQMNTRTLHFTIPVSPTRRTTRLTAARPSTIHLPTTVRVSLGLLDLDLCVVAGGLLRRAVVVHRSEEHV